jgi:ATP-dependent Clp protease ATP-binding subunit ClpC
MFDRMTDRARRVLVVARYEVEQFGQAKIGTEHILLAMVIEAEGAAGKILRQFDVQEETVRQAIVDHVEPIEHPGPFMFTPNAELAFQLTLREVIKVQGGKGKRVSIDTEDLLLGIVLQSDCSAVRVLETLNVNLTKLLAVIEWSSSGVEKQVSELVQSGQVEEALGLLQTDIDSKEAVLERVRALRDQVAMVAAGVS